MFVVARHVTHGGIQPVNQPTALSAASSDHVGEVFVLAAAMEEISD